MLILLFYFVDCQGALISNSQFGRLYYKKCRITKAEEPVPVHLGLINEERMHHGDKASRNENQGDEEELYSYAGLAKG
jgi:hypothetical protein